MFHDARLLPDSFELRADLCIVGAGAVGIAMARELIGQPIRVVLLSSGDLRFRRRPQSLYEGENIGAAGKSLYRSRFRMFGGSTTRWGGLCRPLQKIDFERREWVPHSGWPFSREDLEPFYRRAQEVCNLGPYEYDVAYWTAHGERVLPVDTRHLSVDVLQFAYPSDLGVAYGDELASAGNIDVHHHADVLEIEVDDNVRHVTGLRVASERKRGRVVAGTYVVACGGIENARLLLASNAVVPAGLGNQHGLVGRYFQDHPYFSLGYYEPSEPRYDRTLHVIEDYERVGCEQKALAAFALPEDLLRRERLNGAALYFLRRPDYKTQPEYFSPGGQSFIELVDMLRSGERPGRHLGRHVRNVVAGLGDVATSLGRQVRELFEPRPRLALRAVIEQTPSADSRVMLGERRDHYGMPRVQVDWRLNADDQRGLARLREIVRHEFGRLGLGRLVEPEALGEAGWPASMTGGMHHMGTTRMHADPRQGVVDPDCRVHGLANLYVGGNSVFPTGGVVNPTLTIVALALRLADHLVQVIRGDSHVIRSDGSG